MCNILRTLFFVGALVVLCDSYNILVVFPHFGKSHFFLYEPLLRQLASSGHNVTVISYFPQEKSVANYRDVRLEVVDRTAPKGLAFSDFIHSRFKYYGGIFILESYTKKYCQSGLQSRNLQSFLKEKNEFDVVLFQIFTSDCFAGLIKKYNAPVIGNYFLLLYISQTNYVGRWLRISKYFRN